MTDDSFDDIDWDEIREPANPLPLLQKWFEKQCNGTWEHHRGIKIETCDNPGWWVKIDVAGTFMEGQPFAPILENVSDDRMSHGDRWFCCELKENVWHGSGDPKTLNRVLLTFLGWLVDAAPGWPERR